MALWTVEDLAQGTANPTRWVQALAAPQTITLPSRAGCDGFAVPGFVSEPVCALGFVMTRLFGES